MRDQLAPPGNDGKAEEIHEWIIARAETIPESPDRIEFLKDVIHRLQFEQRWQGLTCNQLEHMPGGMSDEERAALAACKNEKEREERIEMYARTLYFRRCAWSGYLNGEDPKPPIEPEDTT